MSTPKDPKVETEWPSLKIHRHKNRYGTTYQVCHPGERGRDVQVYTPATPLTQDLEAEIERLREEPETMLHAGQLAHELQQILDRHRAGETP